jgi:hypothetical protein
MNTLAKRIHNITPNPLRLTFADETTVDIQIQSAEFFQEAFQGEGVSIDDHENYRIITEGENDDTVVAGKQVDDGWEVVGVVTGVTPLDSDA